MCHHIVIEYLQWLIRLHGHQVRLVDAAFLFKYRWLFGRVEGAIAKTIGKKNNDFLQTAVGTNKEVRLEESDQFRRQTFKNKQFERFPEQIAAALASDAFDSPGGQARFNSSPRFV